MYAAQTHLACSCAAYIRLTLDADISKVGVGTPTCQGGQKHPQLRRAVQLAAAWAGLLALSVGTGYLQSQMHQFTRHMFRPELCRAAGGRVGGPAGAERAAVAQHLGALPAALAAV